MWHKIKWYGLFILFFLFALGSVVYFVGSIIIHWEAIKGPEMYIFIGLMICLFVPYLLFSLFNTSISKKIFGQDRSFKIGKFLGKPFLFVFYVFLVIGAIISTLALIMWLSDLR